MEASLPICYLQIGCKWSAHLRQAGDDATKRTAGKDQEEKAGCSAWMGKVNPEVDM